MKTNEKPSETIRKTIFNFTAFFTNLPEHKKNISLQFLEWFVGFSEGDGCFHVSYPVFKKGKKEPPRLFFIITQKEQRVLLLLRTTIGFGTVSKSGEYWRYIVADQKNIDRLISLFNGNLLFDKTNARFLSWITARNTRFTPDQQIPYKVPSIKEVFLSGNFSSIFHTAWLAGFTDADGCFSVNKNIDQRYSLGYRIRLRYILDQKGERWFFEALKKYFQQGCILQRGKTEDRIKENSEEVDPMFRFEVTSFESFVVILAYYEKYRLRSEKYLSFLRIKRLFFYIQNRKSLPWEGKVLRRIEKLIEGCKKIEKLKIESNLFTKGKE